MIGGRYPLFVRSGFGSAQSKDRQRHDRRHHASGAPGGLRHAFAALYQGSIIYKATGNLRAVQILLGYARIGNTIGYLGVDVEGGL